MKVFLDTNVILDALLPEHKTHASARLLLALGHMGEFELWTSPTQWTDMHYILSEGGKKMLNAGAKELMASIRKAVRVSMMGEDEIDRALASRWVDFEDAVVYWTAKQARPDVLVTENKADYAQSEIPVFTSEEFFSWLEEEKGIAYAEV